MTKADPETAMDNPAPGFKSHPGHTIAIWPRPGTVVVRAGGRILASTDAALELKEADYPPVLYIPFADIDFAHLARTPTSTHCPFKGEATYWQAGLPGDGSPDVMWTYEKPYDEMEAIRNHGAFYPDRVTIEAD